MRIWICIPIFFIFTFIPSSYQQGIDATFEPSVTEFQRSLYFLDQDHGIESILSRVPMAFGKIKMTLSSGLLYASLNNEYDGISKLMSDPWALRCLEPSVIQSCFSQIFKESLNVPMAHAFLDHIADARVIYSQSLGKLLKIAAHEFNMEILNIVLDSPPLRTRISKYELEYILDVFIQSKRFEFVEYFYEKELLSPQIYGNEDYFKIYIKTQTNGMPFLPSKKIFLENSSLYKGFQDALDAFDLPRVKEYLSFEPFVNLHIFTLQDVFVPFIQELKRNEKQVKSITIIKTLISCPYMVNVISFSTWDSLMHYGIRIHSNDVMESILQNPMARNVLTDYRTEEMVFFAFNVKFPQIISLFQRFGVLSKLNYESRRLLLSLHSFASFYALGIVFDILSIEGNAERIKDIQEFEWGFKTSVRQLYTTPTTQQESNPISPSIYYSKFIHACIQKSLGDSDIPNAWILNNLTACVGFAAKHLYWNESLLEIVKKFLGIISPRTCSSSLGLENAEAVKETLAYLEFMKPLLVNQSSRKNIEKVVPLTDISLHAFIKLGYVFTRLDFKRFPETKMGLLFKEFSSILAPIPLDIMSEIKLVAHYLTGSDVDVKQSISWFRQPSGLKEVNELNRLGFDKYMENNSMNGILAANYLKQLLNRIDNGLIPESIQTLTSFIIERNSHQNGKQVIINVGSLDCIYHLLSLNILRFKIFEYLIRITQVIFQENQGQVEPKALACVLSVQPCMPLGSSDSLQQVKTDMEKWQSIWGLLMANGPLLVILDSKPFDRLDCFDSIQSKSFSSFLNKYS